MNTHVPHAGVIPNQTTLRFLVALISLLALANLLNILIGKPLWPVTRHIDLGSDTNMAAWFSSVLLALGGLIAIQCAEKSKNVSGTSWEFYLLSMLLFAMSCDEIARLHETVFGDFAKLAGIHGQSFATHAAWVWVGGPIIAVIFVSIAWTAHKQLALVHGTLSRLILGLALMFLGGVLLESGINFLNQDALKSVWELEIIVEESLEMIGSLIIASALIKWRDTPIAN